MNRIKRFIVLALLILLSSCAINAEEKKGDLIDPDKGVEIKVLEERIKALSEKINNQQKTLGGNAERKVLEERINSLKDELKLRSESLEKVINSKYESTEKLINVYVAFIGTILTIALGLLTFFGYKTIKGTIKKIIEPQAKTIIKKLVKELKEEGRESLGDMLAKLEKDESLKDLIVRTSKQIKGKDISEYIQEESCENLAEFDDKLVQTKTENQYTYEDWFYKGMRAFVDKKYEATITYMSKAIELDQERSFAYLQRGISYDQLNQHNKAIEDYSEVIELDQEDINAYFNRGYSYNCLNQHDKAIEDYSIIIELDHEDIGAYRNRAYSYNRLNQHNKAIEDYNKIIELGQERPEVILSISELEIIAGDCQSALDNIKKALSIPHEIGAKATALYLEYIAKKLLDLDTTASEKEFNEILQDDFTIEWSFYELESWLEGADIEEDIKKFIIEKTEELKKHKI